VRLRNQDADAEGKLRSGDPREDDVGKQNVELPSTFKLEPCSGGGGVDLELVPIEQLRAAITNGTRDRLAFR
jgi:hypothetical protein